MRPGYFLGCFLAVWLAAVVILIAYRILTGRISLQGLFTMDGDQFSPERLQLILVTVGLLAAYAQQALGAGLMPPVSSVVIAVFAASHAVYLGGKVAGR